MRNFLIGLAIFAVSLYGIGTLLLPSSAEASHKVWLYCHKADGDAGYKHWVKQSGVHIKYSCPVVTGMWSYVYAPWPH